MFSGSDRIDAIFLRDQIHSLICWNRPGTDPGTEPWNQGWPHQLYIIYFITIKCRYFLIIVQNVTRTNFFVLNVNTHTLFKGHSGYGFLSDVVYSPTRRIINSRLQRLQSCSGLLLPLLVSVIQIPVEKKPHDGVKNKRGGKELRSFCPDANLNRALIKRSNAD